MKPGVLAAAVALAVIVSPAWAAPIAGTVLDNTSGVPLPKSDVMVFGERPAVFVRFQTRSTDDGTFVTSDLPPGNYTISFGHKGFLHSVISLSVEGGEAVPNPCL
jgi:hypothetical protein